MVTQPRDLRHISLLTPVVPACAQAILNHSVIAEKTIDINNNL
jgi:hypothetical protein